MKTFSVSLPGVEFDDALGVICLKYDPLPHISIGVALCKELKVIAQWWLWPENDSAQSISPYVDVGEEIDHRQLSPTVLVKGS